MSDPRCAICGCDNNVQFNVFNPEIPPFGTACVECEQEVVESLICLGIDAKPADCDICESGQVYHGLTEVLPRRAGQLTS